ncbi:MAG: nucleotide sugar dehydrogenase [Halobacteria archaeon]
MISVLGLGRLGLSFAASVANKNISVKGIDIDPDRIERIQNRPGSFEEPHLGEYLINSSENLDLTTDASKTVDDSDITFIFVNTYDDEVRGYSLDQVENAVRTVSSSLDSENEGHLIVLRCTVMPGDIEDNVIRWIESESCFKPGEGIHLCYWPEFTALGSVVESIENPEYRVIGEYTETAGDKLLSFIEEWGFNGSVNIRMDVRSAEIAKIALNNYVSMKMSYANYLGRVCHELNADVDSVTHALGQDGRVSEKYFTSGVKFGGPCFPHDTDAFEELGEKTGLNARFAHATRQINENHSRWISDKVRQVSDDGDVIGVLGLTYKPGVRVIESSQGRDLVEHLNRDFDLALYDPMDISSLVNQEFEDVEGNNKRYKFYDNLGDAIESADTAVITLRDGSLYQPNLYKNVTLIDPWRFLSSEDIHESTEYYPLGEPR